MLTIKDYLVCDKFQNKKGGYCYFKCSKCNAKTSVRAGTDFHKAKLSLRKFVLLVYTFITHYLTYSQGCII